MAGSPTADSIVEGQSARRYMVGDVSLATSFSPLAAILIAMVLLGEDPGPGLLPGGAIILLAIGLGQFGRLRSRRTRDDCPAAAPAL